VASRGGSREGDEDDEDGDEGGNGRYGHTDAPVPAAAPPPPAAAASAVRDDCVAGAAAEGAAAAATHSLFVLRDLFTRTVSMREYEHDLSDSGIADCCERRTGHLLFELCVCVCRVLSSPARAGHSSAYRNTPAYALPPPRAAEPQRT
jgi:hypothetical protein